MTATPAAVLRAAAERLRWLLHEDGMPEPVRANWQASDTMKGQIAVPGQPAPVAQAFWGGVAEYMVAMQPTVGVALADWLDQDAEKHLPDSECRYCDPVTNPSGVPCPGLAVARALGGTK